MSKDLHQDAQRKIAEVLRDASVSATFSADALKHYNNALESLEELEDEIAKLQVNLEGAQDIIKEKTKRIQSLEDLANERLKTISNWKEREKSLEERERKIFEAEKEAAVAKATADTALDMFRTVFRPNVVRETIQRNNFQTGSTHFSSDGTPHIIPAQDTGVTKETES